VHPSGHDYRPECEYQKRVIARILFRMETTDNTLRDPQSERNAQNF
jgi:hypothetical protein